MRWGRCPVYPQSSVAEGMLTYQQQIPFHCRKDGPSVTTAYQKLCLGYVSSKARWDIWNQDPRESRGHHYSWEKPDYPSWARSWSCPWACWVKGHWLCVHASWGPRWSFLPVSWKSGRNLCVAGSELGSEGKGFSVLACLGLTLVAGGSRGRPGFGLGHGGSFWLEEWCLFDVLCCWHVSILGDIINPGSHRAITLHTVLTHLTEMGTLDRLPQDLATVALPLVSMTPQCTIEWSLFRPGSVLPSCEALPHCHP